MNTFEQWGIILAVFIIIVLFGEKISRYTKKILGDPGWDNIFVGFFVGIVFSMLFGWYSHKDENPYDWCFNLPSGQSEYCTDLYDKSIEYQKQFYENHGDPNDGAPLP